MNNNSKGFGLGGRHVSASPAPQLKAGTSGAVPQGPRPLADTPARSTSGAKARPPIPRGTSAPYSMKNAEPAEIRFPLCDAAVRKIDSGDWELADAIVKECSETGDDGVRNESYAHDERDA